MEILHIKLRAFVLAVAKAAAGGRGEAEAVTGAGARDGGGDTAKRGLDAEASTFGPVLHGF